MNYTSRAEIDGPGLKESIKKVHRAGEVSGVMANVRLTMQPPIANMLEGGKGRSSTQSSLL